jgi:hypothetical protein
VGGVLQQNVAVNQLAKQRELQLQPLFVRERRGGAGGLLVIKPVEFGLLDGLPIDGGHDVGGGRRAQPAAGGEGARGQKGRERQNQKARAGAGHRTIVRQVSGTV